MMMTPNEARALGCAFFDNRYGVLRLCYTFNTSLWPDSRVYNTNPTCVDCINMLARRVERALQSECSHPDTDSIAADPQAVMFCRHCGEVLEA